MERFALWFDPYWNSYGRYGLEVLMLAAVIFPIKPIKHRFSIKIKNRVRVKLVRQNSFR